MLTNLLSIFFFLYCFSCSSFVTERKRDDGDEPRNLGKGKEKEREREKKEKREKREKIMSDSETILDSEESGAEELESDWPSEILVRFLYYQRPEYSTSLHTAFDSLAPEHKRSLNDIFRRVFPFDEYPTSSSLSVKDPKWATLRARTWDYIERKEVPFKFDKWMNSGRRNRTRDAKNPRKMQSFSALFDQVSL